MLGDDFRQFLRQDDIVQIKRFYDFFFVVLALLRLVRTTKIILAVIGLPKRLALQRGDIQRLLQRVTLVNSTGIRREVKSAIEDYRKARQLPNGVEDRLCIVRGLQADGRARHGLYPWSVPAINFGSLEGGSVGTAFWVVPCLAAIKSIVAFNSCSATGLEGSIIGLCGIPRLQVPGWLDSQGAVPGPRATGRLQSAREPPALVFGVVRLRPGAPCCNSPALYRSL